MADESSIIIEPIPEPAGSQWTPIVGSETSAFLSVVVPDASKDSVRDAAVSIVSKTVPPTNDQGKETGLAIGYVQSGKTMSYEAVTALAHDNAFQIVIVIAGIATSLLEQSTNRLCLDLHIDDPNRPRRWIQLQNPSDDDDIVPTIRNVLEDWRDPDTPRDYKKTILITVLKNHRRLQALTELFLALNLHNVPTLIIDDEADQASLNIEVTQGQESTTYRRLMDLRNALPTHTYLQYTATPQAPLLVSIIDSLSPNFVEVLDPGHAYVGARDFFGNDARYIHIIPPHEVPTPASPLVEPPETLLSALRVFMVGVTAGIIHGHNTGNRSMLVHPSHRTAHHVEYYNWVRDIFDAWRRLLVLAEDDADRLDLIQDFLHAYHDLSHTVGPALPAFDTLVASLRLAFRNTRVLEVNARSGPTPPVDWRSSYGWILVGGQAMDRGFTVEGLTVTYMPRGLGVGNADTVQQRARFFGYKREYLGYCRVFLEQQTYRAFQTYVDHEEDIRTQLRRVQHSGQPLNEWKRAFVLDSRLRPCRHSVLEFDYMRGHFADTWVTPRIVFSTEDVVEANRHTVARFVLDLSFQESDGHQDRTDIQRHHVCRRVSLRTVVEGLLVGFRVTSTVDSQRNTGLLLQLSYAMEANPDEVCTIYRMSPRERRVRGIDEGGEITNLFQGEAPVHPREQRGVVYPGDRAIREHHIVTVQIHEVNLTRGDRVVSQGVPVLAVWVPERIARSWLLQEQQ